MMKVGIITHYYKNLNYGGTLQSYALCRVLRDMGIEAEQICYDMQASSVPTSAWRHIKDRIKKLKRVVLNFKLEKGWRARRNKFFSFQESIPHSKNVYHKDNIKEVANLYDIFVTGSDQVWNTEWYHPAFFLDFVPQEKTKVAYAASLGKTEMDATCQALFERHLKDYRAISVREADAVNLVSSCTSIPVIQALDPTMLLSAEQWDELCADRIVKEKYIFCFLLGDGEKERQAVSEYAYKKGLKIVTLPHFPCNFRNTDRKFGDISLYDVSPAEFISLAKYAEYVFTDSFHAAVFSSLYKKSFFVFDRNNAKKMHSRIVSLLSFYGCQERFLDQPQKMSCEYIDCLKEVNYFCTEDILESERKASIKFLKDNMVKKNED